jgi:hypothetical protein
VQWPLRKRSAAARSGSRPQFGGFQATSPSSGRLARAVAATMPPAPTPFRVLAAPVAGARRTPRVRQRTGTYSYVEPMPSGMSSAQNPSRNAVQSTIRVIENGSINATSVPMPLDFTYLRQNTTISGK